MPCHSRRSAARSQTRTRIHCRRSCRTTCRSGCALARAGHVVALAAIRVVGGVARIDRREPAGRRGGDKEEGVVHLERTRDPRPDELIESRIVIWRDAGLRTRPVSPRVMTVVCANPGMYRLTG